MIAEELFITDPLSFCVLAEALDEDYKGLPLYAIYLHQFALNDCFDDKVDERNFIYEVDEYLEKLFPELDGISKVILTLDDDNRIVSVDTSCFVS